MLNKMLLTLFEVVLLGVVVLRRVESHGYMKVPPNRGSAWREDPLTKPSFRQANTNAWPGQSLGWQPRQQAPLFQAMT
jgi:predicted carbohydrate-binding protein with CBM5 and CBM33 domain